MTITYRVRSLEELKNDPRITIRLMSASNSISSLNLTHLNKVESFVPWSGWDESQFWAEWIGIIEPVKD